MFRPLVAYAGFAFVLLQVTEIIFPRLYMPEWTNTFIVVFVLLGFPVTIFFAWVYDITPKGIRKTVSKNKKAESPDSTTNKSKKYYCLLLAFLPLLVERFGCGIVWLGLRLQQKLIYRLV